MAEFYDTRTTIYCSNMSIWSPDLRDGICHSQNRERPALCVATIETVC